MNNTARIWIVAIILTPIICFAFWCMQQPAPYSAARDPIYLQHLQAEKMLRDDRAIPVRVVK